MRRYAEDTTVPIAKSRAEIDRLLREWGADGIQWSDEFRTGRVVLRFIWPRGEHRFVARFSICLPTREELEPHARDGRTGRPSERKLQALLDGRGRSEHRVLLLWLKAALNAVEVGLVEPEAVFLPFLEGSDGRTFAEVALPQLGALTVGRADRLLPALGGDHA